METNTYIVLSPNAAKIAKKLDKPAKAFAKDSYLKEGEDRDYETEIVLIDNAEMLDNENMLVSLSVNLTVLGFGSHDNGNDKWARGFGTFQKGDLSPRTWNSLSGYAAHIEKFLNFGLTHDDSTPARRVQFTGVKGFKLGGLKMGNGIILGISAEQESTKGNMPWYGITSMVFDGTINYLLGGGAKVLSQDLVNVEKTEKSETVTKGKKQLQEIQEL